MVENTKFVGKLIGEKLYDGFVGYDEERDIVFISRYSNPTVKLVVCSKTDMIFNPMLYVSRFNEIAAAFHFNQICETPELLSLRMWSVKELTNGSLAIIYPIHGIHSLESSVKAVYIPEYDVWENLEVLMHQYLIDEFIEKKTGNKEEDEEIYKKIEEEIKMSLCRY